MRKEGANVALVCWAMHVEAVDYVYVRSNKAEHADTEERDDT